jgi:glycosyltransferase involved in cell wall biosynthesis
VWRGLPARALGGRERGLESPRHTGALLPSLRMARRAAYFLLSGSYFGRPLDDGVIRALLDGGLEVDVFSPGEDQSQDVYGPEVRRFPCEYRLEWLARNANPLRWRPYELFLGTLDVPAAVAASFAKLARRPTVIVADEIYLGGYEPKAPRGRAWRRLIKSATQRACLTVITDHVRDAIYREWAGVPPSHPIVDYPSAFVREIPTRPRSSDEFIVSVAGNFNSTNGGAWIASLMSKLPPDCRLLLQTAGHPDPIVDAFLRDAEAAGRIIYRPDRLLFLEAAEISSAAHAAIVLYVSPYPQFRMMGFSSTKLCMALSLGQPVIATRQPSFEFIESRRCGVLIEREDELPAAIETVRREREAMSVAARTAFDELVRPAEKLTLLAAALRQNWK